MNLLQDPWIGASFRDGTERRIRPAEMANPDVVDIVAPRPDFRGALHQFFIGLLQTTFAPREWPDWMRYWKQAPSVAELDEAFASFRGAFELDSAGPAFMQELDWYYSPEKPMPCNIGQLLMTHSDNAEAKNLDHFIHRDQVAKMCGSCAATALLALQTYSHQGGPGFNSSVRGAAPITTLLTPIADDASLWKRVWMNVLELSFKRDLRMDGCDASIFPWLAPTRTSQAASGVVTTPEQVHPLQVYWSMSRRIRLGAFTEATSKCDLCGEHSGRFITAYERRQNGVNYTGAWIHPLRRLCTSSASTA